MDSKEIIEVGNSSIKNKRQKPESTVARYERLREYVADGYSQSKMAMLEHLSRERIRQLLNDAGIHKKWKKKKEKNKNKCSVCGAVLNSGTKYCKEHSPFYNYLNEHNCLECGEPTIVGERSLGLCRVCYNKINRKDYNRPKRRCILCNNEEYICSNDLCVKCYNRLKSRAEIGLSQDNWRVVYNIEFEKEFITKFRREHGIENNQNSVSSLG